MNMIHIKKINFWLYHPVLHTFLLPVAQTLFGAAYAARFTSFQFIPYLVIYAFLLINKLLENQLTKQASSMDNFFPKLNLFLEALNVLCLLYFYLHGSILMIIFPLIYTLVVHFQYMFLAYDMALLALSILAFFKGVVIQAIVFYASLTFLPSALLLWSLPMFFPLFLLEANRWEQMVTTESPALTKHFPSSVSLLKTYASPRNRITLLLSLLIGIGVLSRQAGWWALFLLISLVSFGSRSSKRSNKMAFHLFLICFSTLYTVIWLVHYIPR
ncbi:hypothetical protein [Atopococcus tabaci]|uniref:hypothetical protein n=1 Tax=Atopococcus tabaci TaxID=269774 RepID=UPI00040D40FB|nr:hypothetical protein [Atopococcus tabaci]